MASNNEKLPPIVEALSGSVGASLANVIVYPLDLVAARIQTKAPLRRSRSQDAEKSTSAATSTNSSLAGRSATSTAAGHGQAQSKSAHDDYADMFTAMRTIYRSSGGLSGFYQGIASDTLSTALSQFLYFYMFAALVRVFNKHVQIAANSTGSLKAGGADSGTKVVAAALETAAVKVSAVKELLIGSIAGILSRGVTTPLSTITVRKQTAAKAKTAEKPSAPASSNASSENLKLGWGKLNDSLHREHADERPHWQNEDYDEDDEDQAEDYAADSSMAIARDIYQEHGLTGFWRGYKSACALTINPALTFYLIAAFKGALLPRRFRDKPTQTQTFLISAFASAIASAVCYPLILTKTRLQWKSPNGKLLYRNMTDVIVKTVKRAGVQGLYVGLQTQIIKGFIAQGVTMVVKQRAELLIVHLYRALVRLRRRRLQA